MKPGALNRQTVEKRFESGTIIALLKRFTIGALVGLLAPAVCTISYCLQAGSLSIASLIHSQLHVNTLWMADVMPLLSGYGWMIAAADPNPSANLRSRDLTVVIAGISLIPILVLAVATYETYAAVNMLLSVQKMPIALARIARTQQYAADVILALGGFALLLFLVKCNKIVSHLRTVEQRIAWQNTELEARNERLEKQKDELRGREEQISMTADCLTEVNQLLQQASHRFEELFQSLPVACFCFDSEGRIFEWNRASEAQYGLTAEQAFQRTLWDAVGMVDEQQRVHEIIRRVFNGETVENSEWVHTRTDGVACNVLCSTFPLRGGDGEVVGAISANVDITDLNRAQEHLRDSEERFRSAIHSMQEGLLLIDRDHCVRLSNYAAERIFGTDGATLVGRAAHELEWRFVCEDGKDLSLDTWPAEASLTTGMAKHEQVVGLVKSDGEPIWLSMNCAPLFRTGDSLAYAVVVTVTDITQRKHYEQRLKEQMVMLNEAHAKLEVQQAELLEANAKLRALATLDGLTGLKNHRALQERLDLEQQRAARYNIPLSLIFLDVDKFKLYNDTFGHPAGDEVLKTVARVLQHEARVTDFVARYGGEEFAIILTNTDYGGSIVVSERIRAAIEQAGWKDRLVTASFGVTTMLPSRQTAAELISEADKALYWSKQHGRNRVTHVFHVLDDEIGEAQSITVGIERCAA